MGEFTDPDTLKARVSRASEEFQRWGLQGPFGPLLPSTADTIVANILLKAFPEEFGLAKKKPP